MERLAESIAAVTGAWGSGGGSSGSSSSSSSSSSSNDSATESDAGDDEAETESESFPSISYGIDSQSEEDAEFYVNLDRVLESKKLRRSVRESISMTETKLGRAMRERGMIGDVRTTRYDPSEYRRGDPMLYGAYRRWQPGAETEESSSAFGKGGTRSGAKSKTGGGGRSISPGKGQAAGQAKGKGGKGKTVNGKESFMNAIKNLGSAPTSGPTGTGVADPPANKKNVRFWPLTRRQLAYHFSSLISLPLLHISLTQPHLDYPKASSATQDQTQANHPWRHR